MSLIETACDALKNIPMSDILRERLSMTIDQLAISEAKIEVLQRENGKLASRLDQEQFDHNQTKQELQALRDFHAETIRFVHGIEFKKGVRSGHTAIQPTGAELKMKFPGFNIAEHVIRSNVSHDQTLAKAILDRIQDSLSGNIEIRS